MQSTTITIPLILFIAALIIFGLLGFFVGIAFDAHKQEKDPLRKLRIKGWRRIFRTIDPQGVKATESVYSVIKHLLNQSDEQVLAEAIAVAEYFGHGVTVANAVFEALKEAKPATNGYHRNRRETTLPKL